MLKPFFRTTIPHGAPTSLDFVLGITVDGFGSVDFGASSDFAVTLVGSGEGNGRALIGKGVARGEALTPSFESDGVCVTSGDFVGRISFVAGGTRISCGVIIQ